MKMRPYDFISGINPLRSLRSIVNEVTPDIIIHVLLVALGLSLLVCSKATFLPEMCEEYDCHEPIDAVHLSFLD